MLALGLTSFFHDSAVALVEDGRVLYFAEEERFTRVKHTGEFPLQALREGLQYTGRDLSDIDVVGFYCKPVALVARRMAHALRWLPWSLQEFTTRDPGQIARVFGLNRYLRSGIAPARTTPHFRLRHIDHHSCHAASTFFPSPFEEAAIFCVDGAGEDITTWFGAGKGQHISRKHAIRLPHSLGLFYSAVTTWLGFKPWGGEGKVMGLAAYGDPDRFYASMRKVIGWSDAGDLRVDLRFFEYHLSNWQRWVSPRFIELFGPARVPESEMTAVYQDVAAALQRVTEEAALALAHYLHRLVPSRNLCLAGGVALNSVMNGRIQREGPFERIFIQPSANDAGTALGAALLLGTQAGQRVPRQETVYLGADYDAETCAAAARAAGLSIQRPASIMDATAEALAAGRIVAWFQGRMEVGPRALGNRSILADPRPDDMKDRLNLRVKHRETFRPFAPSVLAEEAPNWFGLCTDSPHMLLVSSVLAERQAQVPAITHVDGTARVQTVTREANARYYDLIAAFGRRTGVPMLLNTSCNVRGEPIVRTPADAVRCFVGTNIDVLALGDLFCTKPGGPV